MSAAESDVEISQREKLKKSLHHSVGKVCQLLEAEYNVKFSKQFISILSELTYRQLTSFGEDLELFSRHAKRSIINVEDIKLLVRKSESLLSHINNMATELGNKAIKDKVKKKKRNVLSESE